MSRKLLSLLLLLAILVGCRGAAPTPTTLPRLTPGGDTPLAQSPTSAPTPLPAPVGPAPTAALDPAIDTAAFPPGAPLVVVFDQPVQIAADQPPLFTAPWTDGAYTWDETHTRLSFAPSGGFAPGRAYQVYLNSRLASADDAQPLKAASRWSLQVTSAPRVLSHTPGESWLESRQPEIRLEFDRPMDAASVESALIVQPAVTTMLNWQGNTLLINLPTPLPPGERYAFTLSGSAADLQGVPLGADYRWEYATDPLITRVSAAESQLDQNFLTVALSEPADSPSWAAAARVLDSQNQPVDGAWRWTNDTLAVFSPAVPIYASQVFRLHFTNALQLVSGEQIPAPPDQEFKTPPPILSFSPQGEGAPETSEILIEFALPVDQASAEAAFNLEPAAAGRFSWRGNTLVFTPQQLAFSTRYQVSLLPTLTTPEGEPLLLEVFSWEFNTTFPLVVQGAAVSWGDYGPNAQVLDVDGRRAVQFVARQDISAVDFVLYRLSLEQFLESYSSNFRGVAGYEQKPIPTAGAAYFTTWVEELGADGVGYDKNIHETLIPDEVPAGLYILQAEADTTQTGLILVLTRNTLVVKQVEGEIFAWLTNINGEAVEGASLSVYTRDGEQVAQGRSGENGLFETTVTRDPQPLIVVAMENETLTGATFEGTDITVCGLSNEWRGSGGSWWGWWQSAPTAKNYAAFVYTDRPIYRPGQSVFFKAILRADTDAELSLLPPGTPVQVRIRDARENVVQTYDLSVNEFGSVNGEFRLGEGAMLGVYNVEVVLEGQALRGAFKVEDYRKPDYQVSVTTDRPSYVAGDTVQVSVLVSYYFGEPVADAALEINSYALNRNMNYWWAETGSTLPEFSWVAGVGESFTGRTDQNGVYTFSMPAQLWDYDSYWDYNSEWGSSLRRSTLGIEVSADDGSRQQVAGFAPIDVYSAPEKVELTLDSWLVSPTQPLLCNGLLTDVDGAPLAERRLTCELRRYSETTYGYDTQVGTATGVTGADGRVRINLPPAPSGYYQVRLRTAESTPESPSWDNAYVYIYRAGQSWASRYTSGVQISADRASYAPGETATLLISSSFSGPALLSFERGSTRRAQPVTLTPPLTLVEVEILAEDAPNIYAVINAWQAQDTRLEEESYFSQPDSRLYTAAVELVVPVTDKTLQVEILPDQAEYNPRQEATFTLRVTDAAGAPVRAEVSLSMVDEAIYALSEELAGSIFDAFYAPRPHLVRTYNGMALTRELVIWGRGGGGDDTFDSSSPRADFPDTAFWFPTLYTDDSGEVTVTVTLPDSLTSWRLTARAVSLEHEVGETKTNVLTRQPLVVRPVLPRGLVAGDTALLTSAVHNYTGETRRLEVTLQVEPAGSDPTLIPGALEISGTPTQSVELLPGEVRYLGWSVTAAAAGQVSLLFSAVPADGLDGGDAVRLPLDIRPLAAPEVDSRVGEFEGSYATTLVYPFDASPQSTVQVEIARSITGSLLEGLEYLTGFPYGCVEQTMSAALPNAVVGRLLNQLGVADDQLSYDLPPKIQASLQRLYGYQHNDGGWGWWYDDASEVYNTAWVVFGLAVTAEAGAEVDPQVIARGVTWLSQNLSEIDPRTRAFALYSLAYAGYGELEATLTQAARAHELDTFSTAALILALHRLGESAEAQRLLDRLAESAVQRDGLVFWPSPHEDGHYNDKVMSSTVRSTALALDAFVTLRPGHPLEAGIVRWLMSQRSLQGWGSTNETSFSLLALTDYTLAKEAESADAPYEILLNGVVHTSGTLVDGSPAVFVELPITALEPGANALELRTASTASLYYRITQHLLLEAAELPAAGNVPVIRSYTDPQSEDPLESITAGQLVEVVLEFDLPDKGFYLILEDQLPGGLEALNENLNTTSHVQVLAYEPPEYFYWRDLGYNYKEIRSGRVSFFITEAEAGLRVIRYLARATFSGTFTAMPATVSAMYDPSYWGRSDGVVLVIGE